MGMITYRRSRPDDHPSSQPEDELLPLERGLVLINLASTQLLQALSFAPR
jgi:hypothetical protein